MKPHFALDKNEFHVCAAPLKTVRALIAEHHYARGSSNTAVYAHVLVHVPTGNLVGAAQWLPPTRVAAESVSDDWQRVLGLSRLVVLPGVPTNAASFLLARSTKAIRHDNRYHTLLTYADESQGHTGTIYRAAGWEYICRTKAHARWIDPNTGRQVSVKATTSRSVAEMVALGYCNTGRFHKHKFTKRLKSTPQRGLFP